MLSIWKRVVDQSRRDLRRSSGADLQRWRRGCLGIGRCRADCTTLPWFEAVVALPLMRPSLSQSSRGRRAFSLPHVFGADVRQLTVDQVDPTLPKGPASRRACRPNGIGNDGSARYMHHVTWHRHLDAYRTAAVIAKADTE